MTSRGRRSGEVRHEPLIGSSPPRSLSELDARADDRRSGVSVPTSESALSFCPMPVHDTTGLPRAYRIRRGGRMRIFESDRAPRSGVAMRSASRGSASRGSASRANIGPLRRFGWAATACLLVLGGFVASVLGGRAVTRSDAEKERLAFHVSADQISLDAEAGDPARGRPRRQRKRVHHCATRMRRRPRFDRGSNRCTRMRPLPGAPERRPRRARARGSQLKTFERRARPRIPCEPLGPHTPRPRNRSAILPARTAPVLLLRGRRPSRAASPATCPRTRLLRARERR